MLQPSLVGRVFESTSSGTKDDRGFWTVIHSNTERVTFDGINWEQESISFMGIDKNFDEAHKTALRAYISWMEENVYQKGLDSLVVAVRLLKEEKALENGNKNKDNEPATT